ncbi:hypothetical protein JCGZ_00669 [Jatropha curcas]|uniref:F-box domain-containing protein n=1 Tax=Jatropha curcas TaxID=180498 RepID=A0A067KS02_JATCU|nr:F-box protein CPR1 [Jatropha curcas]KDP38912.1 hypothetical protein JCGZ_00669 [Jatropha curcas]
MKALKVTDHLLDEVILEILSHLPPKCLIKCTIVCKSWYSLIKSPQFISTHLAAVNRNRNRQLVLVRVDCPDQYSLHFDNKALEKYMSLPGPSIPLIPIEHFEIVGSCNGIVCFSNMYELNIILWNPSIRKSLILPQAAFNSRGIVGFGFDSSTNDYKVFRMLYGHPFKTELYSLNSGSWKDITEIAPFYKIKGHVTGASVNGALHWVVGDGDKDVGFKSIVMVFDVKDEVFREIMLPECLVKVAAFKLSVIAFAKSSIAVIKEPNGTDPYHSHIWMMKEYGVRNSWEKFTVGKRWKGRSTVLGFRANGQVLMKFDRGQIASFDLVSQRFKNLVVNHIRRYSCYFSHVESLILLN